MQYQLAEINIATFRVPMSDPVNAGFIAQLERVNALAECAPGFVWRLVGEGNNAMDIRAFDNPNIALNMSVWKDVDALASFVYRSEGHREIMRRRREWFDRMEFHLAMWWVEAGHHPTIAEGKARLEMLSRVGPSAHAFLFNKPFPPPNGQPGLHHELVLIDQSRLSQRQPERHACHAPELAFALAQREIPPEVVTQGGVGNER